MQKNKDTPALDVFSLGKTTFNFYHETLKDTKKEGNYIFSLLIKTQFELLLTITALQ